MDLVSFVETDFSSSLGIHAGSTHHVSHEILDRVRKALGDPFKSAGGGAANTAKVFSALGGAARFAGAVGGDDMGRSYRQDLEDAGVDPFLSELEGPTGLFCVMIARDGTRSVIVNPGAASGFDPTSVPDSFFEADAVLYADAFLATQPGRLEGIIRRAERAGMRIALDVGGHRLAAAKAGMLRELIRTSVDWAFMNEDEFIALSGMGVDEGLSRFSSEAKGLLVVKRAEEGAVCLADGGLIESPVRTVRALDETGAGDAFSAGFLYAALSGAPVERCLRLGNRVAEHAIQVPGMALDRNRLRENAKTVF